MPTKRPVLAALAGMALDAWESIDHARCGFERAGALLAAHGFDPAP